MKLLGGTQERVVLEIRRGGRKGRKEGAD